MSSMQKPFFLLLLMYTLLLAYLMLFGFGRFPSSSFNYNLVPFATIKHFLDIEHLRTRIGIINLLGNIGMFIPFGILLPFAGWKKAMRAYGIFLAGLCILELAQLISRRGSLDIDDIILNSLGFWLGYSIYGMYKRLVISKGASYHDRN